MSFDSVFHGAPSVNTPIASGGVAALGIDVTAGQLYYRSPTSSGWQPTTGSSGGSSVPTIATSTTGSFSFQQTPFSGLDAFTQSDAGSGATWNTIILKSSGSTANNLRKSLSVYYQGDLHQAFGNEYYGIQSNAFAILDVGSLAGRIASFGGQFGWKGSAAVPVGLQANGIMVQGRATGAGCTGGVLTSFISFSPQITGGATVDTAVGVYIDHAALNSSNVTNKNIGISVYTGNNGWGLDLVAGNGSAFGSSPLVHTDNAIINGGSVTDGWYAGSGSPEGAVTANVGSFFSRHDGGAGTSFYVKESGTGNTGWVGK